MKARATTENNHEQYQWAAEDPEFLECFMEHGFVIGKKVFPVDLIKQVFEFCSSRYCRYKEDFIKRNPSHAIPWVGITRKICEELERDPLYQEMYRTPLLLGALEKFLGPDLSKINATGFFPVDPANQSSPIVKAMHQEIWTGGSIDDINSWIPLHDTLVQNTLAVIPGSHFFGMLPNRNREVILPENFDLPDAIPLSLGSGDIVLFHSLTLHGTAGFHSADIRYAIQLIFRNTNSPMTAQQRGWGFVNLKQGVLARIKHVLGNELLTPLRTYGGKRSNYEEYY